MRATSRLTKTHAAIIAVLLITATAVLAFARSETTPAGSASSKRMMIDCRAESIKSGRRAKRKARLLGTKKSGGADRRNAPAGPKHGGPQLEAALD